MGCSLHSPLSEDALSAAVDGSADESTLAHLAQCAGCRARLDAARSVEHMLHSSLHRFECPSSQELADYHLGLVDSTRDRAIINHIAQCATCTAEIEVLRSFLDEAPQRLAVSTPVRPEPARMRLGEVFARLLPRSPQMALRGAASTTISAEIDDLTILLDPQPHGAGLTLYGQLLTLEQIPFEGAAVSVLAGDMVVTEGVIDDLGSFSVGPILPGRVDVRLALHDRPAIWVKDIDLT